MPQNDLPVSPPRAWAEINLGAMKKNLAVAREAFGGALMAVVKAGAYGHGLEEIARSLAQEAQRTHCTGQELGCRYC